MKPSKRNNNNEDCLFDDRIEYTGDIPSIYLIEQDESNEI